MKFLPFSSLVVFAVVSCSTDRVPTASGTNPYRHAPFLYAAFNRGIEGFVAQSDIIAEVVVEGLTSVSQRTYPGSRADRLPVIGEYTIKLERVFYSNGLVSAASVGGRLKWLVRMKGKGTEAKPAQPYFETSVGEQYLVFFRKAFDDVDDEVLTLRGPSGRIARNYTLAHGHEVFGTLSYDEIVRSVVEISSTVEPIASVPVAHAVDYVDDQTLATFKNRQALLKSDEIDGQIKELVPLGTAAAYAFDRIGGGYAELERLILVNGKCFASFHLVKDPAETVKYLAFVFDDLPGSEACAVTLSQRY
ncbi:MAG: hypothetical protein HY975_03835 [Candidatus Kerfeldbacteria bacterium]|nr:hypothetical protein [Candidatus Kerfeldbacteria bacterium]